MKKHILKLTILGAVVLFISSCTMYKKSVPVAPINVQVLFQMQDLEYIGEVTGTATQSYVMGMPYGGRRYTAGAAVSQTGFALPIGNNRGYNNALYDALSSKPDADFLLPISFETKTDQMFLGKQETITLRAKAFKVKTK
ncbi:MAG: hypothetical protein HND27_04260 [Bacteroidetes bacterium]|nr:hypothetical protein [Flavobacteriales bacterium]NOG94971.1 hypothetical protein [Bacteroidota bacterium]WKZ74664.1 MAG: hypothetical protein QY303_10995 [Vicingaceae bacterium]MCL4815838.1 hypothetical protein [Flavobacteriales bacterium]NUM51384.1 hypothetical protein [Flavobacteriales bacterium]